jgi:adenylyl- and sulfurtransferase ThiI
LKNGKSKISKSDFEDRLNNALATLKKDRNKKKLSSKAFRRLESAVHRIASKVEEDRIKPKRGIRELSEVMSFAKKIKGKKKRLQAEDVGAILLGRYLSK